MLGRGGHFCLQFTQFDFSVLFSDPESIKRGISFGLPNFQ